MNLVLVRAGIRTADVLLAQFYGLAPLEKAGPDPLTPRGFDRVVLGVLRELRAGVAGKEKKAIEALLRELEGKDWAKLGEAARDKAFRDAAEKYLGFGPDVGAAVGQVARHVGPTIIAGTKAAAIHRDKLRVEPSLNAVDERMVVAAATHQALFARDEHGRRSAYLSDRARAVVSQGLEEGLDRYEIAKRIRSDLGAAADVRSENYWRLIASVFTGRARSYGHLSAMSESGIGEFEFEAVLDEVTTNVCRMMHGRRFSVGSGLKRFAEVEQAKNPEDVKDLQPWVTQGKTEDGSTVLFYRARGGAKFVAGVDESAVGERDKSGKFSNVLGRSAMERAGMTTPPLHGHCRSTVLPVLGSVGALPGGLQENTGPTTFDPTVHARGVSYAGTSAEKMRPVFEKLRDPDLIRWLGANPVDELVVAPRTTEGGNGAYSESRGRLQLAHERNAKKFGKSYAPGETFSVAQLGATKEDAVAATLHHELGHHFYHAAPEAVRNAAARVYAANKKSGEFFTKYAGLSEGEHFAEVFAAYFLYPELLKEHSPRAYKMVEAALDAGGLKPKGGKRGP